MSPSDNLTNVTANYTHKYVRMESNTKMSPFFSNNIIRTENLQTTPSFTLKDRKIPFIF